jgi:hypothetical protein
VGCKLIKSSADISCDITYSILLCPLLIRHLVLFPHFPYPLCVFSIVRLLHLAFVLLSGHQFDILASNKCKGWTCLECWGNLMNFQLSLYILKVNSTFLTLSLFQSHFTFGSYKATDYAFVTVPSAKKARHRQNRCHWGMNIEFVICEGKS